MASWCAPSPSPRRPIPKGRCTPRRCCAGCSRSPTSTDTQALVCGLLSDTDWVSEFLADSIKRLGDSYARTTALLDRYGIPYVPAEAGFSVWIDLRALLSRPGLAAERELWARILHE